MFLKSIKASPPADTIIPYSCNLIPNLTLTLIRFHWRSRKYKQKIHFVCDPRRRILWIACTVVLSLHTAVVYNMSRRRHNGNRLRRNTVRTACVLQRARRDRSHSSGKQRHCNSPTTRRRRRRRLSVDLLQINVTEGHEDSVTGVRQRNHPVRLLWHCRQRLRCVVSKTAETVRVGPVEVHEHHVRRSVLRWLRLGYVTQRYEK